MNKAVKLALIILPLVANVAHASPSQKETMAQQLPVWLSESNTPAAAVGYIEQGIVKWTLVEGKKNQEEVAERDTLFNVASLMKPVTAQLALILESKQRYSLQDKAQKYWVDEDIKSHEWLPELAIHHLLSHQSGFPNWRYQTNDTLGFIFKPGSRPGYSGEGYQYLAEIMQAVTGNKLDELAKQHLLDPLNMHNTYLLLSEEKKHRVAQPTDAEGNYLSPQFALKVNAADDLYTSVTDYTQFVAAVMNGFGLSEKQDHSRWQISHDMSQQICDSGRLPREHCPSKMGFTQGWARFDYANSSFYAQGGGDAGVRALAVIEPSSQKAVVVFTNGDNGMSVIRQVVWSLLRNPHYDAFLAMQAGEL